MRCAAGLLVLLPREGMYTTGRLAGLAWLPLSSWPRGLLREKLREAIGFTNLRVFGFLFQAVGFVDRIVGDLLVILVSKQRMNNNYYNHTVKKNKLKDLTCSECQHLQCATSYAFVSLNVLNNSMRERDMRILISKLRKLRLRELSTCQRAVYESRLSDPQPALQHRVTQNHLPAVHAGLQGLHPLSMSPPCLTTCICLLLLQHHQGPSPVPLRDCRGPVQALGLHQCRGEGRQLYELRSHPARGPGPPEGAPGLHSFLPAGEDKGDCWLHLRYPHCPPCTWPESCPST